MEKWAWVDERDLVPFRAARVCMTCQYFSWGVDGHCHTLLGCTLRRGLLQHGEHLTRQCDHWASVTEAGLASRWWHEREKRIEGNPLHALPSPYAFAELHASAEL